MSVGTVDETDGGLDNFDEDAAIENLSNVGADVGQQLSEGEQHANVAEPNESSASEPRTLSPAPQAAGAFPDVPTFEPIGPPPPPPPLTKDYEENVRRGVEWQRALVAHHNEVTNRQTAINEFAAKVATAKGAQEARLAAQKAEAVRLENAQTAERRARAQAAIDAAVQERIESKRDLESFKWEVPHTGSTIAAMIFGAIGAALQNTAAAQLGHVGNAEDEAMNAINARMKRDYDAKKAKYSAAGDALLMAKYGVKTAEDAHRAAMNDLNADFAARYKLVAEQAESVLKQQGVPAEQAKGNALVTNALQEASKQEAAIHDREEAHRIQTEQNHATLALARANLGERRLEHAATLDERRAARAAAAEAKAAAAAEKKAKADEGLAIRDGSGIVRGLAPSSRVVKPIQDRVIQYDDAIKSAEDLLAYRRAHGILGSLPTGEAYDRAVLAVAATTQANASDATTAHEAGTLKKMGLVDEKAIEKTIEHLKERQAAFMRQLRPVDSGDAPARGGKAPAAASADLSDIQAATLIDRLRTHPDDPRAPRIKQRLRDAGYKVP